MGEYKLGELKEEFKTDIFDTMQPVHFDKYFFKTKLYLNMSTYHDFFREYLNDLRGSNHRGLTNRVKLDLQMLLSSKYMESRRADRYVCVLEDYKKAYAIASNYAKAVYEPIEAVLNHIMCTLPALGVDLSDRGAPWLDDGYNIKRFTQYHIILDIRDHTYLVDRPYEFSISSAIRYSTSKALLLIPMGGHRNVFLNRVWRKSDKRTKIKIEENQMACEPPKGIKRPINFDKRLWKKWLGVYNGD